MQHDHETCEECKGASKGARDHYALGRLRGTIARELRLTADESVEIPLNVLLKRRLTR